MKKIYSLMLLAVGCVFIASCGDNDTDNPYAHESVVKIVSALPLFEPEGGTAKFAFSAPGPVTVSSTSSWVTAVVENDSIVVTVPVNGGIEGRNARLFVKYGDDEVPVSVQQKGMTFSIDAPAKKVFSDDEASASHKFNAVIPLEVYASEDWITVTTEDNLLKYSVTKNETGHVRGGYVYYQCGPYRDSINVVQGSIDDLVGNYVLSGLNADPNKSTTLTTKVSIELSGANALVMNMKYMSYKWQFPLTFNKSTLTIGLRAGQNVGKMASYEVHSVIYNSLNPDILGVGSAISMTGHITVKDGATVCTFADNGTLATAFSNTELKSDVLKFYTYKDGERRNEVPNFAFRNPVLTEDAASSKQTGEMYIWKP